MPLPPDFPDVPELSPEERTVGRLLAAATEGIARAGSATPRLDALLLLEDALRRTPDAPQKADRKRDALFKARAALRVKKKDAP